MKRRLIWIGLVLWLVLTAGLLMWSTMTASAAAKPGKSVPITTENAEELLRDLLREHPELILDVLHEHSETVLDVAQEGAILRRNKTILGGWMKDLEVPKTVNLSGRAMRGAANAPVTIVAFSDFTCPYCQQAAETLNTLLKEFSGKIRYVFKGFPLESHGNARLATEYFVAAGMQGSDKAWQLYDTLFSQRERLLKEGEPVLKQAAKDAGLDMKRLSADLKSKNVRDTIEEDIAEGTRYGVEGTPTFLVNNLVVRGAMSRELFAKAIAMALEAQPKSK